MKVVEVSSNNQYKTGPFNRGDKLTARHLETIRDAGRGNAQIRNPDNFVKRLPGGHILTSKRKNKGGGSSLIWLTTDNTGLSFADGAKYNRPGGTGSALTVDDTYYISTPWNTRIVAPTNHFGYFVQNGTDWYKSITQFSVKPSANYPSGAGAGITSFTCYLERSDSSLNLGTNTAFPSGIKIILDGFDNENAALNSLNFFNGKVFDARFDTAANIIYLDKASF